MADDLRTRIARAIYNEVLETSDGYVEGQEGSHTVDPTDPDEAITVDCRITFTELADAVIRELKQQWRADYGYDGYQKCGTREEAVQRVQEFNASLGDDWQDGEQAMVMTRHVTEWETD